MFSDAEYPELTANMTSRSRGKQPAVSSDESDSEPEGVYRHTRTRTGAIPPIDYNALARGIEVKDLQASNSSIEKEAFIYMTSTPEETARRLDQQAQVQKEQLDMILAQRESIDSLKQMLAQLLEDRKKSPPKKSKGKKKREKARLLCTLMERSPPRPRPNPRRKGRTTKIRGRFIPKE